MACDGVEVAVVMQHFGVDPNSDSSDETVEPGSNGFARAPACSIDAGGLLEVAHTFERNQLVPVEQAADAVDVVFVALSGEKFHDNDLGRDHVINLAGDESIKA